MEVTQVTKIRIVRLPRKRKGKTSENWRRKAKGSTIEQAEDRRKESDQI